MNKFENLNVFELTGVVKFATDTKASVSVACVDYVVPVYIENANTYIDKEVHIKGHVEMNFDNVKLVGTWVEV